MNGKRLAHSIFRKVAARSAVRQPANAWKVTPMGLFKSDLYRAFFLGFGITSFVMAAHFVPHLV